MKQFRQSTLVFEQLLCAAILIVSFAWPAVCQQNNEQKVQLVVQTGHADAAQSLAFSPDGKYLAISSGFNTKLWNIATGQELRPLEGGKAIFSPDGTTLATSTAGVKLWNWRTGQELRTLRSSDPTMRVGAFSPKGDVLACLNYTGGTISLWDVKSGKQLRVLAGHTTLIGSVVFSADGKTLAADAMAGPIKLWNWQTGEQLRTIETSVTPFSSSLAFSPNGDLVIGVNAGGTITLWDTATGQTLREIGKGFSGVIFAVAFTQGGKALAILGIDFHYNRDRATPTNPADIRAALEQRLALRLLDVQTGQELRRIEFGIKAGTKPPALDFQFSPDDKALAILGIDRNPKLLDAITGRELQTFAGNAAQVTTAGASSNNSLVASGNADGSIKLWDVQRGAQIRSLKNHDFPIEQIVFSQDNRTLVGATKEIIELWDVEAGRLLKSLPISDPATQRQVEAVVPNFYQLTPFETVSGKFRLLKGENGRLNVYDNDTMLIKVSLVSLNENDWAAVTPEGLFDASPGARRLMHYVTGLEPVQLEQM
jgi:WD40 repeat protein